MAVLTVIAKLSGRRECVPMQVAAAIPAISRKDYFGWRLNLINMESIKGGLRIDNSENNCIIK